MVKMISCTTLSTPMYRESMPTEIKLFSRSVTYKTYYYVGVARLDTYKTYLLCICSLGNQKTLRGASARVRGKGSFVDFSKEQNWLPQHQRQQQLFYHSLEKKKKRKNFVSSQVTCYMHIWFSYNNCDRKKWNVTLKCILQHTELTS